MLPGRNSGRTPQEIYRMLLPNEGVSRDVYRQWSRYKRANFMLRRGVHWGTEGNLIGIPIVTLLAATAPRGEKLATGVSGLASTMAFPAVQGVVTASLSMIPGVGQGTALTLGLLTSMGVTAPFEDAVSRGVKTFTALGERTRRLEMGGSMYFSEAAQQSQAKALQEMSGAMIPSRRYLGQEARLMHR